jgi:predicted enzyme related to lactoylglutathione lyase
MTTQILGLRTVIYKVNDLNKAKDWYSKAFNTNPYFDESFYVGFNVTGYELGLHPEEKEFESKSKNVFTYWGVEDIYKEYQRFLDLGATTFEEPTNVGGKIVTASVKDLWGNIIGLIYNPEFKINSI